MMTQYEYKVYFLQPLMTVSICLLILSGLSFNKLKNVDSNITFYSFILAIPFIFHLVYLVLFSNDVATSGKALKLYLTGGVMLYFSLIWYLSKIN
jgi:hypothetical protein